MIIRLDNSISLADRYSSFKIEYAKRVPSDRAMEAIISAMARGSYFTSETLLRFFYSSNSDRTRSLGGMPQILAALRQELDRGQIIAFSSGIGSAIPDDFPHKGVDAKITYSPISGDAQRGAAVATLTPQSIKQVDDNRKKIRVRDENIPGIADDEKGVFNRGHLIADCLGGSAKDPANFVALYENANQQIMKQYEMQVLATVRSGKTVKYRVTPRYRKTDTIPYEILMEAYVDDQTLPPFPVQVPNVPKEAT